MKRTMLVGTIAVVCSLILPNLVEAQTTRALGTERYKLRDSVVISGTVTDRSGEGLRAATVIAKNNATGFVVTVTADDFGFFRFSDLPDGPYSLSALTAGLERPVIKTAGFELPFITVKHSNVEALRLQFMEAWRSSVSSSSPNISRRSFVITPRGKYL